MTFITDQKNDDFDLFDKLLVSILTFMAFFVSTLFFITMMEIKWQIAGM
jgi:hypothetical protein